jgi:hypothetical protein
MDTLIFVLLVVAVVIVMSLRIYFHQRRSKMTDAEAVKSEADTLEGGDAVEDVPEPKSVTPLRGSSPVAAEPSADEEVRVEVSGIYKWFTTFRSSWYRGRCSAWWGPTVPARLLP